MKSMRTIICAVFLFSCVVLVFHLVKTRQLEDHTPPVITCAEDEITVSVSADDAALFKGVTAEDDKDGDITDSVRVSAMTHFIEKGKRTITYIVFDQANQAGTAQRTVLYSDYESPKIYLSEPLRYSLSERSKANPAEYMTAEDCLDGDITKQIRMSLSDDYFNSTAGEYDVTAQVTNSAGDVRVIPLKVTFVDNSNREESMKYYPVLSEYIVYTGVDKKLSLGSYITGVKKGNAVYSFEEDGEFLPFTKSAIDVAHEIDYGKPGVYPVEYSYTTEEGIEAVTRLYVVVEEQ